MRTILFLSFLMFLMQFSLASDDYKTQSKDSLPRVKEITLKGKAEATETDSYGRLYLVYEKGVIVRLDTALNQELVFSPSSTLVPATFIAQNPNQLFVFYQELQEWVVLNRFLTEIERYEVSEKIEASQYIEVGFVRIITPSPNNTLWFFDESDFSLKNYDVLNRQILSQTPLSLLLKSEEYPITFLRFYQGQIFLGVEGQGNLIFDNFGNYRTTLEYPTWQSISFFKENMLISYEEENTSTFISYGIYDKTVSKLNIAVSDKEKAVIGFFRIENKYVLISPKKVSIYKIQSKK